MNICPVGGNWVDLIDIGSQPTQEYWVSFPSLERCTFGYKLCFFIPTMNFITLFLQATQKILENFLENFKPHIHLLTFSPNQTDSLLRFFNNGLSESHFPTFQLLVQTSPTLPPQHPCLQLHSLPPSFFSCVPYPICLLVSFPHSSTSGATVWTD